MSPDAELRWGVLGTARIAAQQVIPAIGAAANGRVLAVSSGSGRAGAYAERLGIPRAYASHDELLADAEVDAVYIPLPNTLHQEWAVRAARAGKHVLCEKPIALSPAGLAEIEAACTAAGVHLAEAFMYRHHPQVARLVELLAAGRIGTVAAIEARFHFVLDAASGPNIRLDGSLGGGALRDIGCYPIDLMNLLMAGPPSEVAATAAIRSGTDVDAAVGAVLRYGEVVGTWSCGFGSSAGDGCLVLGSAGTIEVATPFRPDKAGGTGVLVVTTDDGTETIEVTGDQYRLEVEDFARRVLTGDPDETGLELSRWTADTTARVAAAAGLPGV